jgi:hypothetical protein
MLLEMNESTHEPISVHLVDFGYAKWKDEEVDIESVGTTKPIDYRAPEGNFDLHWQFVRVAMLTFGSAVRSSDAFTDELSDCYSMATMMHRLLWTRVTTDDFMFGELSMELRCHISLILVKACSKDRDNRIGIENLIKEFEMIQMRRNHEL